ncbi:Protein CBG03198 [Caenorhabditis briggsae]|uniref:Uncharacterized protein n=2 Tax=Caenorhabditis briggsae TaxID=6238 RepID=A0AAE9DIV0_CAEBR|nr:Protein CBG03198 [Caenorhabditis briggsae]ULU05635.1 hypothetical protein L3Y34_017936 [Caenorhabditis briggsae]UMM17588.1 hypothetical protein L5515_014059 [Caenorhabditis briggsae]CAP23463.2 Protein CBG03198 [Caenorhabditis briggsae]
MFQVEQPYSGFREVSSSSSFNVHSTIPDRFWFNPAANQIVISKLPPTDSSTLVIANIVPGEAVPSLNVIYEQFIFQQRDAFNQNCRKDCGYLDSNQMRSERQSFYNSQIPQFTLAKKHFNVFFQNDRNPNGFLVGKQTSTSKLPFWMKIVTPDKFSYTTVMIANSPKEGVLHLLLRHGHQFRSLSKDILKVLPSQNLKQLCRKIRDYSAGPMASKKEIAEQKENLNNQFLIEMSTMEEAEFSDLLHLQREMRDVIQKIVQQENYLGESINTNGQQQVYWKSGSNEVMVLGLSEQLFLGEIDGDNRGRKRPIRKIITIFVTGIQDYEKKKNNKWPVTKLFGLKM